MAIAPEDIEMIAHIDFVCGNIHDFGNQLYEGLMDRDHEEVKVKAKELIEVLDDLIQALTEDI